MAHIEGVGLGPGGTGEGERDKGEKHEDDQRNIGQRDTTGEADTHHKCIFVKVWLFSEHLC